MGEVISLPERGLMCLSPALSQLPEPWMGHNLVLGRADGRPSCEVVVMLVLPSRPWLALTFLWAFLPTL